MHLYIGCLKVESSRNASDPLPFDWTDFEGQHCIVEIAPAAAASGGDGGATRASKRSNIINKNVFDYMAPDPKFAALPAIIGDLLSDAGEIGVSSYVGIGEGERVKSESPLRRALY